MPASRAIAGDRDRARRSRASPRPRSRSRAACRSSAMPRSSSCCATTRRRSCAPPASRQQNVQVVLINARAFNAFVMDGRRIFVNVGALYDSKTPNEIIGVLAHETGHISGGHLSRLREQMANAQTASIIALLLGVGAIAAGAATGSNNIGQVGAGRHPGAAGDDPPLAPLLCARAGRSRPTARRSSSSTPPASPPRGCTRRSSASPTTS